MRILLVEDEPNLLTTLARGLRGEGYAVDTADNGDDGLMKALDTDYDTIILDVLMPGLDGWQVLEGLRKSKKTPVLMLTARDAIPDRIRGLDSGADDYLTKPCHLDELFARVRALIRRHSDQPNPQINVGDIVIDTAALKVFQSGKEIVLTAREFALVEYLAMRRGQFVSRTTLYEHLLDEEDSTASNLMDVYIYNLRKKLGSELIQTRRGVGYCIE
ncbi:MAG: response regulator transcription factor [Verrucomicrobiota bacterium]